MSAHLERVHCVPLPLKQVQLRWFVKKHEGGVCGRLSVQISMTDHDHSEHREWICQRSARENVEDSFSVPSHLLQPGHRYEFVIKLMIENESYNVDDNVGSLMQVLSTETLKFRSSYTMSEMKQLQAKAIGFVGKDNRWLPCRLFYRDQDDEYYYHCRCIGFLLPRIKNENGDPASPINGCIEGVFLGVSVDWKTGELPNTSPYGPVRFHIPIECLYRSDFNLYFADFYCHTGSQSHHLTLVLTRRDSPADIFCKLRLPKLDIMKNPFLYYNSFERCMYHTTAAWIHVFYTERIPINHPSGWFDGVRSNPSKNTYLGKPKNPSCQMCKI